MGKKKTAALKAPRAKRKNSKHIDNLRQLGQSEIESYFEDTPTAVLVELLEETYSSDLVNLLLGLRKSVVTHFFQRLLNVRKRLIMPTITLYYYKDYLTNPLPLTIASVKGERVANYYAVLGVPRDASADYLKEVHKLLGKAYSPESLSPQSRKAGEEESLKEINEAYEVLKSPRKREVADTTLPDIKYLYPKRDGSWFETLRKLADSQ